MTTVKRINVSNAQVNAMAEKNRKIISVSISVLERGNFINKQMRQHGKSYGQAVRLWDEKQRQRLMRASGV